MKMRHMLFFFGILYSTATLMAQEVVNQSDTNGARHGVWKKYYSGTKQLRYEGEFDHGKEIGTFKFYCEKCGKTPNVVKNFQPNSSLSEVKYLTSKGDVVSQGMMDGKLRTGEWLYFHKKSNKVMTREFYKNGVLDGKKTIYYPSGKITEEIHYVDGIKEGKNVYYTEKGILLKELQYANDKLHGASVYYDGNGAKTIEGSYKQGKKNGLWVYYQNGKIALEETYPKPLKKIED